MESLLISPWAARARIWWCCSAQRSEKREIQCCPWGCCLGYCCTSHLGRNEGKGEREKKILHLLIMHISLMPPLAPCTLLVIKFINTWFQRLLRQNIYLVTASFTHISIFNLEQPPFVAISLELIKIMGYRLNNFTQKSAF